MADAQAARYGFRLNRGRRPRPSSVRKSFAMSTLTKVLLGVVTLAAALFAALVVFVTVIVEPNDYRPYIVDTVTAGTGRSFELAGDLGLDVWPCCSIAVAGAALGHPAGFDQAGPSDRAFARIHAATFRLKLWPLLTRREVVVGTVTLDGLELDLVRLADGRDNWTFGEEAERDAPAEDAGSPLAGLHIDGLRVRDGLVRFRDLGADQSFTVSDIRADTGAVVYTERLDIAAPELALKVSGTGLPEGGASASVSAERLVADTADVLAVHLDGLRADLTAEGARLRLEGGGHYGVADSALAGTFTLDEFSPRGLLAAMAANGFRPADDRALARLSGRGEWALTDAALAIDGLRITLDDTTITGSAGVSDLAAGALRFDLTADRLDLDRYLPAGAAANGAEPAEASAIPLDALADIDVDGRFALGRLRSAGIDVDELVVTLAARDGRVEVRADGRAGGGSAGLQGAGRVRGDNPVLSGTLRVDGVSPRALLTAMDAAPDTADAGVLDRLSGTSRWRLQPTSLALEDMAWQLDDSRIGGSALIADFARPGVRFQLDVDRLDVDAYLPAPSDAARDDQAEVEIPVEAIRALNLGGRLRAGTLVVSGLTLSNVSGTIDAADGVLRIDPLQAALYGGEYRGTVTVDATGPEASLALDQSLTAVRVANVLQTWFDSDLLDGSLSLTLTGAGKGNTVTQLLRGVGADVAVNLSDGVYRGMDLLYELRRAQALLRREAAPAAPESRETPIRSLAASGRMVDGVLRTERISAENAYLKLLGSGGINLIDRSLDYRLDAELLRAVEQGSGSRLAELVGNAVPLTLSGPLTSPRVGVDLQSMVTGRLRETVQERAVDALLERLGPRPAPEPPPADAEAAESADRETAEPAPREPSTRDLLRRGLRDLLAPPKPSSEDEP